MTNATWRKNPASSDFNAAGNWNPATVPNGTAIFGGSHTTSLSLSATTIIGGWTFKSNASHYSFDVPDLLDLSYEGLAFNGVGIAVKGGRVSIINHDAIQFLNSSTAGTAHIANHVNVSFFGLSTAGGAKFTNDSYLQFFDTSTAGHAHFTNNDGGHIEFLNQSKAAKAVIINKYVLDFNDSSTADAASITNIGILHFHSGSTAGAASITNNGGINFHNSSTAGSATIKNVVIGDVSFFDSSNAGSARIAAHEVNFIGAVTAAHAHIAATNLNFTGAAQAGSAVITTVKGARTLIEDNSTGGDARFITKAGGLVDFSLGSGPLADHILTAGSIEGAGHYELGGNKLFVGYNNRSTVVSGLISGAGGVLHKVGTGTLTLSHAGNTYSTGTVLTQGTLDIAARGAAGLESIYFDVGTQALKIENKALAHHAFGNVLSFFGFGDVIDLAGLQFVRHAKATYDSGTGHLTVHSGKVTDTLTLNAPIALQFKVVDDRHGGTKIIGQPPGAKQDALSAPTHDSSKFRDEEHRAAGDSFHFKAFAERGEQGSAGLDFHSGLGAHGAAPEHSHDALQQDAIGGFHLDFASAAFSLVEQQHYPVHGDVIL